MVLLGDESSGSCLSSVLLQRQEGMEGVHPLDHSETTSLSSGVQSVQRSSVLLLSVAAIHHVSLGTTVSKVATLQTAG